MGRIIAIDYGLRRVGLAWTDELQISINPLPTVRKEDFPVLLKSKCREYNITEVVIGLPVHADGTLTPVGQMVLTLKKNILKWFPGIKVELIDESFSSEQAVDLMRHMGVPKSKRRKKANVDRMSAVLILKEYLNNY